MGGSRHSSLEWAIRVRTQAIRIPGGSTSYRIDSTAAPGEPWSHRRSGRVAWPARCRPPHRSVRSGTSGDTIPGLGSPLTRIFQEPAGGWQSRPALHNRVHVWVGGDMSPGTSPKRPCFLSEPRECRSDLAAWAARNPSIPYRPDDSAPAALRYHRLSDSMHSIFPTPPAPKDVLDVSADLRLRHLRRHRLT